MNELFAPVHLLILFCVFACFFLIPQIFYILTLQKALEKCTPALRTITPGILWLYLVPFANLVMAFIIVFEMAKTLRNEFNRRGIFVADPKPGQTIGVAAAVTLCCSIIPFVGFLLWLAHLVLWIVYWMKITEYSRLLDAPLQVVPPLNAM